MKNQRQEVVAMAVLSINRYPLSIVINFPFCQSSLLYSKVLLYWNLLVKSQHQDVVAMGVMSIIKYSLSIVNNLPFLSEFLALIKGASLLDLTREEPTSIGCAMGGTEYK